jgi:tetratricopeptide (TPR) repeat protein
MPLRLPKLVRNKTNRDIISWVGGGAALIITGVWAAFTHFYDQKSAPTTTTIVSAPGGFAAGRDIIGLDEKAVARQIGEALKPLTEQQEQLAKQVAREKGVEIAPLRSILAKLGEAGVRDQDIARRLDEKANELISLREEIARLRQGPPELAAYAKAAQAFIEKGELDAARSALASGRAVARGLRERSSRYEVDFLAQEARVDHLQLAYRLAAQKYAEAARLVEAFDQRQRWKLLLAQAGEFYALGSEFGDTGALTDAITIYRNALMLARQPRDQAMTQNYLGMAFGALGGPETGIASLSQAVACYRKALEVYGRKSTPMKWADTQLKLGVTQRAIGERKTEIGPLEDAVVAFHKALTVYTQKRTPLKWAAANSELGTALRGLGEGIVGKDTTKLADSVEAYDRALEVYNRQPSSLEFAATQTHRATALRARAESAKRASVTLRNLFLPTVRHWQSTIPTEIRLIGQRLN